ncbi:MAG: hypothetical protein ACP5HG_04100 [Anaerolineae bacterium]
MRRWILLVVVLLLSVGCALPSGGREVAVNPERADAIAEVLAGSEGRFEIQLGVENVSNRPLAELESFSGRWQLLTAGREVRAAGRVYHLGAFEPGESRFFLTWEAELEPGDYVLLWGAPSIGSVTVMFTLDSEGAGRAVNVRRVSIANSEVYPPPEGFAD